MAWNKFEDALPTTKEGEQVKILFGDPGWVSKFVCAGCDKRFKIGGRDGFFHVDKKQGEQ